MKGLWRRIRAALGLGVIWAGGGAFIGGLVELVSNLFPSLPLYFVDMWIQTLAIPGFMGGVIFSVVLGVAARHRHFDELSYPFVTGLGAVGGVLLGGLLTAMGMTPLIFSFAVPLSVLGASLSLAFGRAAARWELLGSGDDEVPRLSVVVVAALVAAVPASAQRTLDHQVDSVFAWTSAGAPGCVVGAEKDGLRVIERTYGLADLEEQVPLTPSTVHPRR